MEELLRGALRALYARHNYDVTSLSCYVERQLPLRDPFFQLKRVPHFQVRDDLHRCDTPAYRPIQRLENAVPEDLCHRGRAGCRRVLVEGDIGTGKTFLCYFLLHQWAEPKSKLHANNAAKSPRGDDLNTYKLVIYLDCVRLPVSDFLAKCQPYVHKRHIYVAACALLALAPLHGEGRLVQERVYDWLLRNQSETCLIFDNVDASDAWLQIIQEAAREHHGFGKILVCATPERVPKKNIDALYYCYGLHPEYGAKLNASRLKRVSATLAERAALPKQLDSSQELLRNPLILSLLSAYLKDLNQRRLPRTHFELIEGVIGFAMIGDPCPVSPSAERPGCEAGSASLMTICETVAFECIETNTNYFCKSKFPSYFWTKHLCDCRLLHEVHDVAKQGNPVVSFTTRCIRDYLASKRVCRYLLSDRDSKQFLHTLVHRRQFHSVVRFSIRHLVKLGRLDVVRALLEQLLAAEPQRWVKAHPGQGQGLGCSRHCVGSNESFSRGRLCEQKEVLSWLRETDFHPQLLEVVARRFPAILELAHSECPPETVMDFVSAAQAASAAAGGGKWFNVQGMVLFLDGMFLNSGLGLDLARALQSLTSLTTLVVCLRSVVDTGFVVRFLCELFEGNQHVTSLTLEGPFNAAENLTYSEHRRVREVFHEAQVALQNLALEHINYHHRVAYLLSCWPNIFRKLELRKCNLDITADKLVEKLVACRHLSTLVLEHCHVMASTLEALLQQMGCLHAQMALRTLSLTLLSTGRHFARADAKKPTFRPSLSLAGCRLLAQFLAESRTLQELALCHDAIDDMKVRALGEGVARSVSLGSLDLTGNVIGEGAYEDLLAIVDGARTLRALYLHDNCLGAAVRSRLIKSTMESTNLKLSL